MNPITIKPLEENDRPWANALIEDHWGSTKIVTRGVVHEVGELPGFCAILADRPAGLVTYHIETGQCEVITLNALAQGIGVGGRLLAAVKRAAQAAACSRLWLITTNDNIDALQYFQKMGFVFAAIHIDALKASRALKPEIPEIGAHGIPIRDEIELEMPLSSSPS